MNPDKSCLAGSPNAPLPLPLDLARLQWHLVLHARRAWTALSASMLAGMGLAIQSRTPAGLGSPLGLILALAALGSCAAWLLAQRRMQRVERQIRLQASDLGLRAPGKTPPGRLVPVDRT